MMMLKISGNERREVTNEQKEGRKGEKEREKN
jgi:hypothetical protein